MNNRMFGRHHNRKCYSKASNISLCFVDIPIRRQCVIDSVDVEWKWWKFEPERKINRLLWLLFVVCGFREGHSWHAFAILVRGNDSISSVKRHVPNTFNLQNILLRTEWNGKNRLKPILMCSTFKLANKRFITIGSYVNFALFDGVKYWFMD